VQLLDQLSLGFATALGAANLLAALLGCLLGTVVGVLPGIGPVAAIALLLPATYALAPVSALILLAGVYYGAQYAGSTPAILLDLPGEPSSDVTRLDGHQMTLHGRAGPALGAAALASFVAGCFATALLALAAQPLTRLGYLFGPVEYAALLVLALVGVVALASGSLFKALAMAVLGLLLGLVGNDPLSGATRFAFDIPELSEGIGFVALAIGIYAIGEVIANMSKPQHQVELLDVSLRGRWPGRQELAEIWPALLRGTLLGSLLGLMPGGGALLASFSAYALEKRVAPRVGAAPFGKGNIRGVVAPESANNAGAQMAFLPLLALGIPPNAVMALLLGALWLRGIAPGAQLIAGNPALFWGLVASMWIGNLLLLVLNLPLAGLWLRLVRVPYGLLAPLLVVLGALGAYLVHQRSFEVWLVAGFGALGYVFVLLRTDPAPLLLGCILAPALEDNLRRSLAGSGGKWSVFVTQPVAAGLLGAAALVLLVLLFKPRRATMA